MTSSLSLGHSLSVSLTQPTLSRVWSVLLSPFLMFAQITSVSAASPQIIIPFMSMDPSSCSGGKNVRDHKLQIISFAYKKNTTQRN